MRFIFVDRIISVEPGRAIETLKNVSATEDVFADHFPGCPVLPGALIVEAFGQAAQLLIGLTSAFTRIGRLTRLTRGSFRHFVRPGDQLRIRCERRAAGGGWTLAATADVADRRVASATLEYEVEEAPPGTEAGAEAARLCALAEELRRSPLDLASRGGVA
jgi:3-hydroxyacyl-[acyl-carrier-protein] dehydratase